MDVNYKKTGDSFFLKNIDIEATLNGKQTLCATPTNGKFIFQIEKEYGGNNLVVIKI